MPDIRLNILVIVFFVVAVTACYRGDIVTRSSSSLKVERGGDITVVLMPVENLSTYRDASAEVERWEEDILRRRENIKIVSADKVRELMMCKKFPPELIDRRSAVWAASFFRADYAVLCSVLEYGAYKALADGKVRGNDPVVSLGMKVVDMATRNIVYAAVCTSAAGQGFSFKPKKPSDMLPSTLKKCLFSFFRCGGK